LNKFDVIIVGAGAAGLMCALTAAQRGRKVLVIDHSNKAGKKILMSGGGFCNFTNLYTTADNYFSNNTHFCKSALSRYTPYDFVALVDKHEVPWYEKEQGQLFCENRSKDILDILLRECSESNVEIRLRCEISKIKKQDCFELTTSKGNLFSESLVVATGGLSIPTLGATGFGYDIAKQFGLEVLPVCAGLVPFTLQPEILNHVSELSGVSTDVTVLCENTQLTGAMLFTHRGISGPVILQISPYWNSGQEIEIDLLPAINVAEFLTERKVSHPDMALKNIFVDKLPKKMVKVFCEMWKFDRVMKTLTEKDISDIAYRFNHWKVKPSGTEGYRTAEVTVGGVNTDELSSKTMASKKVPGLYFVGEVVDVTGQLGGFNFQWAWASGWAAGQCV
jgi:predicted Rossmann fold flavoprotein